MMKRKNVQNKRSGFTMIETIMSVMIVGIMFASTLTMVGRAKLTRYRLTLRDKAEFLSQSLLAEITSLPYEDPREPTTAIGLEPMESGFTKRDTFNDVDDFHNWVKSPPQSADGVDMTEFNGWSRTVTVQWILPADLSTTSPSETNAKRITVNVTFGNQFDYQLSTIRTSGR